MSPFAVRTAVVVVLAASSACSTSSATPGAPQLLIYIDTDAVLPSSVVGPTTPLDAPALFDTIRIEGTRGGQTCSSCRRDLGVVKEKFEADLVSFGVVAPVTAGDTIRVRLFLSAFVSGSDPFPEAAIDVTASLPPLPSRGTTELTLFLPTSAVGAPTRAQLLDGRPMPSKVGTWAPAKRIECGAPAPSGEVCVPGGAFWMGNPLVAHIGVEDGDHLRLVGLSPFYVDSKEVTAADYRPLATKLGVGADGTGQLGCDLEDYCTLLSTPGPVDAYPINCVDPRMASGYCEAKGKELLTEAQFEYLASGLGARYSYVWGEDTPACGDAILARAGAGAFFGFPFTCLGESPLGLSCSGRVAGGISVGGPALGASAPRDTLTVALPSSTGRVYDLVGNVGEIARDDWSTLDGPCWAKPGVYIDPLCKADSGAVAVRGGDWTVEPVGARAAVRDILLLGTYTAQIGFRCARRVR